MPQNTGVGKHKIEKMPHMPEDSNRKSRAKTKNDCGNMKM